MDKNRSKITILIPLLFFAVFYCYPLVKIFQTSFSHKELSTSGLYLNTIWFSFWQALLSTILTLIVALPGIYIFCKYDFPGKKFLQIFITLPFVLPSMVVASAFIALLGPSGLVNNLLMKIFHLSSPMIKIDQTIWFFILAHIFYNYSVMFHLISRFWNSLDPNLEEAAKTLGTSSFKSFLKITLPLLRPAILAASMLVFIFCFSSFGIIMILGGSRHATIEVEIYKQAIHLFNLKAASLLSITQIIFTFLMIWVYTSMQKKVQPKVSLKSHKLKPSSLKSKFFILANLAIVITLLGAPILTLVFKSFTDGKNISLANYKQIFASNNSIFHSSPMDAILNSFTIACITTFIAIVLGLLAATYLSKAKKQGITTLNTLLTLPMTTSAVTIGFGIILVLNTLPFKIADPFILLPTVHSLIAFPFVLRCILPALQNVPNNLRESAAMLGASPKKIWQKIDLPIIEQAILIGAIFAFTISLGEFGASSLIAKLHTPTIAISIYRLLTTHAAANYGQAMAMSTLLMMTTVVSFVILAKNSTNKIGAI